MSRPLCLKPLRIGCVRNFARKGKTNVMQATTDIAERISAISVSSTMKVAADADRLRREGVDVVDFGAGEPDFPTPDNIKQAAVQALASNFTKYTNTAGLQELRQAICERHRLDFGTNYL